MRPRRPIKQFCECGSGITLVGRDDRFDLEILDRWREHHTGPGHGFTSAGEARDIRAAANRRPT